MNDATSALLAGASLDNALAIARERAACAAARTVRAKAPVRRDPVPPPAKLLVLAEPTIASLAKRIAAAGGGNIKTLREAGELATLEAGRAYAAGKGKSRLPTFVRHAIFDGMLASARAYIDERHRRQPYVHTARGVK